MIYGSQANSTSRVSASSGGHRVIQTPKILGREEHLREKAKRLESEEETDVSRRLIQRPDMKETCSIIFNYILLHFIEMYMSYLAACKPGLPREKVEERQEKKNTHTQRKKDPKTGITKREKKARHQMKLLLGTQALSALTPGPCGHEVQGQPYLAHWHQEVPGGSQQTPLAL